MQIEITFSSHAKDRIKERNLTIPETLNIRKKDIVNYRENDYVWEIRKNILGKSIWFAGRFDKLTGKFIMITAHRCNHRAYGNA